MVRNAVPVVPLAPRAQPLPTSVAALPGAVRLSTSRLHAEKRARYEQTGFDYAMTLEQVAQVLGITRGGAFMAEKSALRKARRVLIAKGYAEDDLIRLLREL